MTKVSFRWKRQIITLFTTLMTSIERQTRKVVTRKQFRQLSRWFLGCLGVLLMLSWNWKLVLATGSGIGLMLLVYKMQHWNWSLQWSQWQQFLTGSQGKLTIAVGSGSLGALGTYLAASVWADSENRWLATGSILQGLGTLLTLLLLIWHILTHKERRDEAIVEQWLLQLTAEEPLKRYMAVRQLTSLIHQNRLSLSHQRQLKEYFHFMLASETETSVRRALLESLQRSEKQPNVNTSLQPLQIPLNLKAHLNKVLHI